MVLSSTCEYQNWFWVWGLYISVYVHKLAKGNNSSITCISHCLQYRCRQPSMEGNEESCEVFSLHVSEILGIGICQISIEPIQFRGQRLNIYNKLLCTKALHVPMKSADQCSSSWYEAHYQNLSSQWMKGGGGTGGYTSNNTLRNMKEDLDS